MKPNQTKNFDSLHSIKKEIEDSLHLHIHAKIESLNLFVFNILVFLAIVLSLSLAMVGISIFSEFSGIKNDIESLGKGSFLKIEKGFNEVFQNPKGAKNYFLSAQKDIEKAESKLRKTKPVTVSLAIIPSVSEKSRSAKAILESEKSLAIIGISVSEISSLLKNNKKDGLASAISLNTVLIKKELDSLEKNIKKINKEIVPQEHSEKFEQIKNNFPAIKGFADSILNSSQDISDALGIFEEKNYLMLFQNNNELRSTGGFIGSIGILTLENGQIKDFLIEDVYSLDDPYSKAVKDGLEEHLEPPHPMNPKFTGNWALRDSNLNPDFYQSAKTALSFYEKQIKYYEGKSLPKNIDGVFGITTSLFEDIIKIAGPINVPGYEITLDGENTLETLQLEVEAGKDKKENKNPKTILSVVGDLLLEKLSNNVDYKEIILSIFTNLDQKNILLYFTNNNLQDLARKWSWSGEMNNEAKDYLMVINNNLGGGKTSLFINEHIDQKIKINNDRRIEKEITITRFHTSDYKYKYYDPWEKQERWLIGVNNNYIKVYVPLGSKLIKAEGFKEKVHTGNENQKTFFGGNFTLKPKERRSITLTYELPFKFNNNYSLAVQKQPGSKNSEIKTEIKTDFKYTLNGKMLEKYMPLEKDIFLIIKR